MMSAQDVVRALVPTYPPSGSDVERAGFLDGEDDTDNYSIWGDCLNLVGRTCCKMRVCFVWRVKLCWRPSQPCSHPPQMHTATVFWLPATTPCVVLFHTHSPRPSCNPLLQNTTPGERGHSPAVKSAEESIIKFFDHNKVNNCFQKHAAMLLAAHGVTGREGEVLRARLCLSTQAWPADSTHCLMPPT